jgi:biopolymer transport protein ExbD
MKNSIFYYYGISFEAYLIIFMSTKAKTNLKSIQISNPQPYSQKDIFVRLQSHSLHTIDELKSILKELYVTINEEAKKDFEIIFSLEDQLKRAGYQSVFF